MSAARLRWYLGLGIALWLAFLTVGALVTRLPAGPALRTLVGSIEFWQVGADGRVLFQKSPDPLPCPWSELPHPEAPYDVTFYPRSNLSNLITVTRLDLKGTSFMVSRRRLTPWQAIRNASKMTFPAVMAWFLPFALFLIWYLRRKGKAAKEIIARIRTGDLKARFRITQMDEIGQLMRQFNEMADTIESAMEKLKSAETARAQLLKELAHDVQTPLTSVCCLIETVADLSDTLPRPAIRDKMETASEEMSYFKRLIEDLFLLEQIQDPRGTREGELVDLWETVRGEISRLHRLGEETGSRVRYEFIDEGLEPCFIRGNPHLLRRLARNALENAGQFASLAVVVQARFPGTSFVELTVRDDGSGFSDQALQTFGKRRTSRFLDASGGRVSLGLGSVIMCAIAKAWGGTVTAGNWTTPEGTVAGGQVRISLPREHTIPTLRQAA